MDTERLDIAATVGLPKHVTGSRALFACECGSPSHTISGVVHSLMRFTGPPVRGEIYFPSDMSKKVTFVWLVVDADDKTVGKVVLAYQGQNFTGQRRWKIRIGGFPASCTGKVEILPPTSPS